MSASRRSETPRPKSSIARQHHPSERGFEDVEHKSLEVEADRQPLVAPSDCPESPQHSQAGASMGSPNVAFLDMVSSQMNVALSQMSTSILKAIGANADNTYSIDVIKSQVQESIDEFRESVSIMGERFQESMGEFRESVSNMGESFQESIGDFRESVSNMGEQLSLVGGQISNVGESLREHFKDHHEKYQALAMERFNELTRSYGAVNPDSGESYCFWSDPFCKRDFAAQELASAIPRLLIAKLYFWMGVYVNSLAQGWLQKYIAGYYEGLCPEATLWDVTFHYLPHIETTRPADFVATATPAYLVFRYVILPGPLSLRWVVLRRWFIVWGTIWIIRSFTIIVTPLPNPDLTCKAKVSYPDNLFREAWAVAFGKSVTCQDVLFSGHTVALTVAMLFICKYATLSPWSSRGASRAWLSTSTLKAFISTFILLVGYYLIAASRFHYTVDVLVGALITLNVYIGYHSRVELAFLRAAHGGSTIFDSLLYFLEKDSKDMRFKFSATSAAQGMWLARH